MRKFRNLVITIYLPLISEKWHSTSSHNSINQKQTIVCAANVACKKTTSAAKVTMTLTMHTHSGKGMSNANRGFSMNQEEALRSCKGTSQILTDVSNYSPEACASRYSLSLLLPWGRHHIFVPSLQLRFQHVKQPINQRISWIKETSIRSSRHLLHAVAPVTVSREEQFLSPLKAVVEEGLSIVVNTERNFSIQ